MTWCARSTNCASAPHRRGWTRPSVSGWRRWRKRWTSAGFAAAAPRQAGVRREPGRGSHPTNHSGRGLPAEPGSRPIRLRARIASRSARNRARPLCKLWRVALPQLGEERGDVPGQQVGLLGCGECPPDGITVHRRTLWCARPTLAGHCPRARSGARTRRPRWAWRRSRPGLADRPARCGCRHSPGSRSACWPLPSRA